MSEKLQWIKFILILLPSFLIIIPIFVYKYAKNNFPKRKYLITGMAMGLIISPTSFSMYGFYYIPYIGLIPGMLGLMLQLFHGEPGYKLAIYLGLLKPATVVEGTGHILLFIMDGIIWAPIYGLIGFILDIVGRQKALHNKAGDTNEGIMLETKKQKPYGLALTSLLLGLFNLAPFAIICGHVALSRIKKNDQKYTVLDRRIAMAGLLFGYIGLLLWFYIGLLFAGITRNWDLSFLFPFSNKN